MIAILDYLVFAMADTELLVPEQATIVKANVNSALEKLVGRFIRADNKI